MEILVQFEPGMSGGSRRRLVESLGAVLKEEIAPQRVAVVKLPEGADLKGWAKRFLQAGGVAHVEPNGEAQPL